MLSILDDGNFKHIFLLQFIHQRRIPRLLNTQEIIDVLGDRLSHRGNEPVCAFAPHRHTLIQVPSASTSDVEQQEHQIILLQIATITKPFVLRTAAIPRDSWGFTSGQL